MNRLTAALTFGCFAGLAPLICTGCKNIPQAKGDLPRVEVEVAVTMDDTFTDSLQSVDATFKKAIVSEVLAKSDVGLRFYPVLSEQYADDHAHPPYLMIIDLRNLHITVSEETKKIGEGDAATTQIHRWVSRVQMTAMTNLNKRRDNAPPLTVSSQKGTATVSMKWLRAGQSVADGTVVKETRVGATGAAAAEASGKKDDEPAESTKADSKAVETKAVMVARSRILDAVDKTLEDALKRMIPAIDRELSLQVKRQPVAAK